MWALENNRLLFPVRPKMHSFEHLILSFVGPMFYRNTGVSCFGIQWLFPPKNKQPVDTNNLPNVFSPFIIAGWPLEGLKILCKPVICKSGHLILCQAGGMPDFTNACSMRTWSDGYLVNFFVDFTLKFYKWLFPNLKCLFVSDNYSFGKESQKQFFALFKGNTQPGEVNL